VLLRPAISCAVPWGIAMVVVRGAAAVMLIYNVDDDLAATGNTQR